MKIVKFLEINKLDKGLFRIWIILSIFWISFVLYAIHHDELYSEYLEESSKSYFCASTLVLKTGDKKEYFPVSGGGDGLKSHQWLKFDNLKDCISWTNKNRNQFLIAVSLIFLIPIGAIFMWFLLKKTFLWLYRGFR